MSKTFKGDGTPSSPFEPVVRHVLELLIADPRISANRLKKILADRGHEGLKGLAPADLLKGALGESLKFRLDVRHRRDRSGAGTSFVSVKLNENTLEGYQAFEAEINDVNNVIEWDQVSGRYVDYIVRIVGHVGSDAAKETMIALSKLPSVDNAYMNNDFVVWKSGIVDKFTADSFLEISPDK